MKSLTDKDFTVEQIRKTAKGWKKAKVHTVTVWHWDGKEVMEIKKNIPTKNGHISNVADIG